jgi:carboxypeptidase Taq
MNKGTAERSLRAIDNEIVLLEHINATLSWDQEAAPPLAQEERAQQIGLLDKKIHELATSEQLLEALTSLGASEERKEGDDDLDLETKALVRQRYRLLMKEGKLSSSFVQVFSETTSLAHQSWAKARQENDFAQFEPVLEKIVSLIQEKAELYGYDRDPYDSLLDNFEPGMRAEDVEKVFTPLEKELQHIVEQLRGRVGVDDSFLYQSYPTELQEKFSTEVLHSMGFDFERGKVGLSTHPYTTSLGADDIRITTRYTEASVASPLYSIIHEGGHALYEMGVSHGSLKGTSLANASSLAFHESQSRLWENMIGRSREFWHHFYPRFSRMFPSQLANISEENFYHAINKVTPSAIRVDADEVTYSLHIMLRFNLERQLLLGKLQVKDLRDAWNEEMKRLLSVEVKNDKEGVLQDVHWSMGEFGYFPTYALGNVYAAQIFETMKKDVDVEKVIGSGDFSLIHDFLRDNVYTHGSIYEPKTLLKKITDEDLNASYYINYLTNKYVNNGGH